jgi:hypothetical protein
MARAQHVVYGAIAHCFQQRVRPITPQEDQIAFVLFGSLKDRFGHRPAPRRKRLYRTCAILAVAR